MKITSNPSMERSYLPQLDSLRLFAVLGVLVAHYLNPVALPWIFGYMDWGHLGVQLFFVLSGFLITGILLDCRSYADRTPGSSPFYIRQFYIRRFLRIFPIYYLVLAITLLTNVPPAREIWPWLVSYTSNMYIWLNQTWIGRLSHFWTLAVEEQFYLFWPLIILFMPRRKLIPAILGIILLAPISRYFAATYYLDDLVNGPYTKAVFTLETLDSLGIGALLAVTDRTNQELVKKYLTKMILPAGIGILLFVYLLGYYRMKQRLVITLDDFAYSLIFCWLIGKAGLGFKGVMGKVLELKPLVYLGKITYGIYIYHNLVPVLLSYIFLLFGRTYPETGWFTFVTSTPMTILRASLSWRLIESPMNSLKRYFLYDLAPTAYTPSKVVES